MGQSVRSHPLEYRGWPENFGPTARFDRDQKRITIFRGSHGHGISPEDARRLAAELNECVDQIEEAGRA
jgi:hypothetical protein